MEEADALVQVDFMDGVVTRVALSFPDGPEVINAPADVAAASRLLHDALLPPPSAGPLNHTLNAFADNLEILSRLDKLSQLPELNCFEAVALMHRSLCKIFEYEKARVMDETGLSNDAASREVLCRRSGRPRMHVNGRVGLSLEYWTERYELPPPPSPSTVHLPPSSPRTWSLQIEVSASPSLLYPPMRVSPSWIADPVYTSSLTDDLFAEPHLAWLEPDPTVLPDPNPDAIQPLKLPDVRYVAKLNPPVVVPLTVAVDVFASLEAPLAEADWKPTTFDGLMFPLGPGEESSGDDTRTVRRTKHTHVVGSDGKIATKTHSNTLHVPKHVFARTLDELPFSHPRQLIQLLPILRQYAALAGVLGRSFPAASALAATTISPAVDAPKPAPKTRTKTRSNRATAPAVAAFLSSAPEPPKTNPDEVPVDMTLTLVPVPRLGVVFPLPKKEGTEGGTAELEFDFLPNGMVSAVDGGGEAGVGGRWERWGRCLLVCGEVGGVVEGVRKGGR
jgi:hypothetical protein